MPAASVLLPSPPPPPPSPPRSPPLHADDGPPDADLLWAAAAVIDARHRAPGPLCRGGGRRGRHLRGGQLLEHRAALHPALLAPRPAQLVRRLHRRPHARAVVPPGLLWVHGARGGGAHRVRPEPDLVRGAGGILLPHARPDDAQRPRAGPRLAVPLRALRAQRRPAPDRAPHRRRGAEDPVRPAGQDARHRDRRRLPAAVVGRRGQAPEVPLHQPQGLPLPHPQAALVAAPALRQRRA